MQPLGVDDAAEPADEGARLLLDLRVHPEVGHEVDVADPEDGTTHRMSSSVGAQCSHSHRGRSANASIKMDASK